MIAKTFLDSNVDRLEKRRDQNYQVFYMAEFLG